MKNTLFLILFFLVNILSAQEPSFRVIGKEDLSGYDIYDIIQKDNGIIILGTNNGVYKYDGVSISKLKSPKLKDKSFFGFKKDNTQSLYCYNLIGEIYKVTEDSIIHYTTIPEDYLTDYFSFEFTENNEIIFSFKNPILKTIEDKYALLFENLAADEFGNVIHKMKDGSILLYNASQQILYKSGEGGNWKKIEIKESIPLNHKISIDTYKDHIYILDHNAYKVYRIKDDKYSIINLEYSHSIKHTDLFSVFANESFCLSVSGGGILLFDKDGQSKFSGQVLFDEYVISGFLIDKEGDYWITTLENAILYINKHPVISYINNPLLKDEFINRVSFCSNGEMFAGTMSGKIIKEHDNKLNLFYDNTPYKVNYLEHKSNYLYASTGVFPIHKSPKNKSIEPNKLFIKNDFEQVGDTFYYATSQGLVLQNEEKKIDTVLLKARIQKLEYIQEKQTLWVATNKGLYSYRNNNLIKADELGHLSIPIDIQQYLNDVWVATESDGVLLYSNGKIIKHLNLERGLLSLEIRKIVCVNNKLFVSHSKGLQIYDIATGGFQIINTSDGLLANNIRDFDVHGDLVAIVTYQGLQKLNYSKLDSKNYKPNVVFTRVLSKEKVLYNKNPELDYSNNSIVFQFTSYAYKYDISYQYKLVKDGNEHVQWNEQQFSSNTMHYPSLSPGQYTFKVKAVTDHLQESDVISYTFRIKSPFWETIPFWIVVILILIKLIHTFYKYTIKKIKEENQIKAELYTSKLTALKSQMNPHFIFNSLNSIQALILKEDVKNSYDYIVKFSTLVRNTLSYSDKSFIDFNDEVQLLNMYLDLEKLRFKEGLNFDLNIQGEISGYVPPLLIQPFVENAIKHGLLHANGKKELNIDFKLGDVLLCSVEDNGIGRIKSMEIKKRQGRKHNAFSVNALEQRFNILNEIHGSQIGFTIIDLVTNNKPSGTRVEIRIPIKTSL